MREGGDLGEEEELARDALLCILKIDFPPLTHSHGQKRCLDTQDHLPTIFLSCGTFNKLGAFTSPLEEFLPMDSLVKVGSRELPSLLP